jgi:tetratricopeptide (TPR) repeat protein
VNYGSIFDVAHLKEINRRIFQDLPGLSFPDVTPVVMPFHSTLKILLLLCVAAMLAACGDSAEDAGALLRKGMALENQGGKGKEAIAVYDEIDRRFGQSNLPKVRQVVARALLRKGVALGWQGKIKEKIAVYEEIDRRFGKDESPDIHETVAEALVNKGTSLLLQQGKPKEAIASFDEVVRRFDQDTSPNMRRQIAYALYNKAAASGGVSAKEGIAVYEEIARRFGNDNIPEVTAAREALKGWGEIEARRPVAWALFNKGMTLEAQGKLEEAIAAYEESALNFSQGDPDMLKMVVDVQIHSAQILLALEKRVEAEQKIQHAIKHVELMRTLRKIEMPRAGDAILLFLLWLVDPKTPLQEVRDAIAALSPDVEYTQRFDRIRPFVAQLPQPRQTQAQCFIAFFEEHHDSEELDACLK